MTDVWGIAALQPTQKLSVDRHCFGDCGKILVGAIDDQLTGGLIPCKQTTCPYEQEVIQNYGALDDGTTVHLRILRTEQP